MKENTNFIDKLFLFASVVKILDNDHLRKHLIHLVFSTFYSTKDLVFNLSKFDTPQLIVRVLFRFDDYFDVIEYSTNVVEVKCSWSHLLLSYKTDNFLEKLIGNQFLVDRPYFKDETKLHNVLFIFENIN